MQGTEIHISSNRGALSFQISDPYSHIRAKGVSDRVLSSKGLSGCVEWTNVKKVVLTESTLVIYPMKGTGRKTTLRLFKGHVVYFGLFFRNWSIQEIHP